MIITALNGTKLDIPDEHMEAINSILADESSATWFEDANGIIELSAITEWDSRQGRYCLTGFQWSHESTGEAHQIARNAFEQVKV